MPNDPTVQVKAEAEADTTAKEDTTTEGDMTMIPDGTGGGKLPRRDVAGTMDQCRITSDIIWIGIRIRTGDDLGLRRHKEAYMEG